MSDTYRPAYIIHQDIEIPQGGVFNYPFAICLVQRAISGPTVARNTAYTAGQLVTPAIPNGYAYECQVAGTTHASNEPTWPTVVGKTVTDGSVTWRCEGATTDREYLLDTEDYEAFFELRDEDFDGDTVLEGSTDDGRITTGFRPAKWQAATAYTDGEQTVPTLLNGFVYEVVVAGTSHATTEPTWPTTLGQTVINGTVTWRAEHVETVDNGLVTNLYMQLTSGITEALTDWGRGVYTLTLIEPPATEVFRADGIARLRREATY